MADTVTFGVKLYMGDGASTEIFTQVEGVLDMGSIFGFARNPIDTSKLASVWKEFLAGTIDPGSVDFSLAFDLNEPTHDGTTGLLARMTEGARAQFAVEFPPSSAAGSVAQYMHFAGVVLTMDPSAAQDDIIRAAASIKISGEPTFNTTAPVTS